MAGNVGGYVTVPAGPSPLGTAVVVSGSLASGVVATYARNLVDDALTTLELVSGLCPVAFGSGGGYVVAQGASGLRMPAVGVAGANVASGGALTVVLHGRLPLSSGLFALWSGSFGIPLYVSTSGFLMTPTQPVTGLSQPIGWAISGGLFVMAMPVMASGAGAPQSGLL